MCITDHGLVKERSWRKINCFFRFHTKWRNRDDWSICACLVHTTESVFLDSNPEIAGPTAKNHVWYKGFK